jgi:hypothetical protein
MYLFMCRHINIYIDICMYINKVRIYIKIYLYIHIFPSHMYAYTYISCGDYTSVYVYLSIHQNKAIVIIEHFDHMHISAGKMIIGRLEAPIYTRTRLYEHIYTLKYAYICVRI